MPMSWMRSPASGLSASSSPRHRPPSAMSMTCFSMRRRNTASFTARSSAQKLAATTNYCDLDLTAGDALTQKIILEDLEIAEDAARVYHLFVQLVDKIQEKRLALVPGGKPADECTPEQIIDTFDFMVGLKARYHG